MDRAGRTGVEEVREYLIHLIAEQSGRSEKEITPGSKLVEDLGLDSFALLALDIDVEIKYGVRFFKEDTEAREFFERKPPFTVEDVLSYVCGRYKPR